MNFKKFLSFCLAVLLIFCFAGCGKDENKATDKDTENAASASQKDYITLLYSAADTFNPYTAKTDVNRQLCKLLYEPLVKLDNEFKPVYSIAQSVVTEGKKCTAIIKNIKFSDGSAVTAGDVVYSANLAKNSASIYASKLYEMVSVVAENANTVVFTLSKQDPYFVNLLDFPIIKQGSENITDSDSVLQPPISCGRYKVSEDKESLVLNELYFGNKGSIKSVRLINAPDMESVAHYVEVGAADIYYSNISDGQIIRMSGKKKDINLNNLVYIGINQNYGALAENALRQAISSGINRKKICQNAYYNNALASNGFFNPVWQEVKALQNIQIEANTQITVENLEKIGYNKLNSNEIRVNQSGNALNFSLLVNSEDRMRTAAAHLIASQLLEYGIRITVLERPYESYIQSLQSGDFQLYLGEIKLTDNMDFSPLVTVGGSAAFGLSASKPETETPESFNLTSGDIVVGFYEGKNTINDIAVSLQTEMPVIPVCYRTGALFCNDNIENINSASLSDIYFSIDSYKLSYKNN